MKDRYIEEVSETFKTMHTSIDNINNAYNRNKQLHTTIEPPTAGALPPKHNIKRNILHFILFVILMYIINFIILN